MGARTRTPSPPTVPRTEDPRFDSTIWRIFRRATTIPTPRSATRISHHALEARISVAEEVRGQRLGAIMMLRLPRLRFHFRLVVMARIVLSQ